MSHERTQMGRRFIRERIIAGAVPSVTHHGWEKRFPWLVQGTTLTNDPDLPVDDFDLRLFGPAPSREVLARWGALRDYTGLCRTVHARQTHGTRIVFHEPGPAGLELHPDADGHVTRHRGVLLTVALADCVPVFLVDPVRRALGLLHCGWRGVAAGMVEHAISTLYDRLAAESSALHVHLGPAICGRCYEVGPEVHQALVGNTPPGPESLDLRSVLRDRILRGGVLEERLTVSSHCTRCGEAPFFSHRGGSEGRQVAFVGMRC